MSAYIGRYHRVRPVGPRGWGAPYVFDRGRAQQGPRLIPAPYDRGERVAGGRLYGEWWRSPEGLWTPTMSGGTYTSAWGIPRIRLMRNALSAAQTTQALSTNYVYGTGGIAVAHRFVPYATTTLATVYYFVSSYTGTAANVTTLNFELRDNSVTIGAGTTLIDSKTVDPSSGTGWLTSTGWTGAVTSGAQHWVVLGDADGNGTDNAVIVYQTNQYTELGLYVDQISASVTAGFTVAPTFGNRISNLCLVMANGRTFGNPITALALSTSSTNQRGLRFIAPTTCTVYGAIATTGANLSGINLWAGSNGPSGSADANGTVAFPQNAVGGADSGFAFGTPATLTQGQTYRLVFTYSGAATTPSRFQIGTGTDATLRGMMQGDGTWYWTEASGTTDWSNDNTSEFPTMDVILDDFVAASGGGGGGFAGVLGE